MSQGCLTIEKFAFEKTLVDILNDQFETQTFPGRWDPSYIIEPD